MVANTTIPAHLSAMLESHWYSHPVNEIKVIETHISWVILTGLFAYKIKKPLNLGFLDFSTLMARKHYCQEELRLNKRFAPDIYLEVLNLNLDKKQLSINGPGETVEHCVKMRQFPENSQLNQLIEDKKLATSHLDALAINLAEIHQSLPRSTADSCFGDHVSIESAAIDNFTTLNSLVTNSSDLASISHIESWTRQFSSKHKQLFIERKDQGFVRECHGDLHLGNITLLESKPVIFDCIEFNNEFRWIDVISDIAFLIMDLHHHVRPDFANRLLNRYLELTGDYQGVTLLRFYLVYRAMVRCKISAIVAHQKDDLETQSYQEYLRLAQDFITQTPVKLMITHGLSGSGKSIVSQMIVDNSNTIRIRSDVERKRLYGLSATERPNDQIKSDMYSSLGNERTYAHLAQLAENILSSGYNVIIDATFLKLASRSYFHELAITLQVDFIIVHTEAPLPLLKQWINERQKLNQDASDATLDVLEQQIRSQDPLCADELSNTLNIYTDKAIDISSVINLIK